MDSVLDWQDVLRVLISRGEPCETQDVCDELSVVDHALDDPIAEMIGLGLVDVWIDPESERAWIGLTRKAGREYGIKMTRKAGRWSMRESANHHRRSDSMVILESDLPFGQPGDDTKWPKLKTVEDPGDVSPVDAAIMSENLDREPVVRRGAYNSRPIPKMRVLIGQRLIWPTTGQDRDDGPVCDPQVDPRRSIVRVRDDPWRFVRPSPIPRPLEPLGPCEGCQGRKLAAVAYCLVCRRSGVDNVLPRVYAVERTKPRKDGLPGGTGETCKEQAGKVRRDSVNREGDS